MSSTKQSTEPIAAQIAHTMKDNLVFSESKLPTSLSTCHLHAVIYMSCLHGRPLPFFIAHISEHIKRCFFAIVVLTVDCAWSASILELQKDRYFEGLTAKYWNASLRGECPSRGDSEGITLHSLGERGTIYCLLLCVR